MYPFDSQICSMQFLEGAGYSKMDLRPHKLSYNAGISLSRYFVRGIRMCTSTVVGKQAIVVEVALGRPLMSNILTVFIPTTILLAISYMTRVFQEEFLDMVYRSTSPSSWSRRPCEYRQTFPNTNPFFNSFMGISQSLPTTAYVKIIDIWMMFTMIIPFIEVVIHCHRHTLMKKLTG